MVILFSLKYWVKETLHKSDIIVSVHEIFFPICKLILINKFIFRNDTDNSDDHNLTQKVRFILIL